MFRRLVSLLLAAALGFTVVGCGGSDTGNTSAPIMIETNTKSGEKVKLTMWCIATEADSCRKSYELAIEEMRNKYPNIEFEWEAIENETYKTKIAGAMASNELPDIFFTWGNAFLGDFVRQRKVYCLDDALSVYKEELTDNMLQNTTYNGDHYGVPTTFNIVALFANMELLARAGWNEIPRTFEDLMQCCEDLKAQNIIPFGCSGSESWAVTEYLEPVIQKSIGSESLNNIFRGRASYNDPGVAGAVSTLQTMIEKGYFDPAGSSLTNDEVKENFKNGKTAFYQNGTWNVADFASDPEFLAKLKVSEFPVINEERSTQGQLIGGPSDTLAVAASSPNAELAAQYAAELGKLICHYGYLDGCGLPTWKPYGDTSTINPLTQTIADMCANADSYVLFGDNTLSGEDKQYYLDACAKVYSLELDGEGFITELSQAIR